jgi:hypothetical protein
MEFVIVAQLIVLHAIQIKIIFLYAQIVTEDIILWEIIVRVVALIVIHVMEISVVIAIQDIVLIMMNV